MKQEKALFFFGLLFVLFFVLVQPCLLLCPLIIIFDQEMPFYHGLKPKFRDILWQDLFVWKKWENCQCIDSFFRVRYKQNFLPSTHFVCFNRCFNNKLILSFIDAFLILLWGRNRCFNCLGCCSWKRIILKWNLNSNKKLLLAFNCAQLILQKQLNRVLMRKWNGKYNDKHFMKITR